MSNLNSFDDFDLDLYSIPNEKDGSAGTNSPSSIICATATNLTENDCNQCSGDALCTSKCK